MQNTDIGPTDFEADAAIIAQRLAATLSRIRKRKLALELIGSDERSNEFKVADFDRFADELSAGVDITRYDRKRIERRALGAMPVLKKTGPPSRSVLLKGPIVPQ